MRDERIPVTPDGRYIVVRQRLWRASNPHLSEEQKIAFINDLMSARHDVRSALRKKDAERLRAARSAVDAAKHALGERGAPWWTDGARDFNRYLVKNTPYAEWYEHLPNSSRESSSSGKVAEDS